MTMAGYWSVRYDTLARGLPALAQRGEGPEDGIFLCGMNICVDARVDLSDPASMAVLLEAPAGSRAAALGTVLRDRAARGIGGELRFDWREGPDWLRRHLPSRPALGGTGPQAAAVLARLGARPLMPLEDRTEPMLAVIPPGILMADAGRLVEAAQITPSRRPVPEIYIFEYTAGMPVGGTLPPRSSRIIVRFSDRGIQRDPGFEAMAAELAPRAAAALVSGLNDETAESIRPASRHVFDLCRAWRDAGLATIHFELAGYISQLVLGEALDEASGAITSLGMSHSELLAMDPSAEDPLDTLVAIGDRMGLDRVCVHADTWAAAITTGASDREERALMAGCLLASARAATGRPAEQPRLDPAVRFEPMPFPDRRQRGRWTFVACAAPFLARPVTTLGLGDSFTAGCLLVLGRELAIPPSPEPGHAGADPSSALRQSDVC